MFHSKAFFSYQRTTHDKTVQSASDYREAKKEDKKEDKEPAGDFLLKRVVRSMFVFLTHFFFFLLPLSFSNGGTLQKTNQTTQEVHSGYSI